MLDQAFDMDDPAALVEGDPDVDFTEAEYVVELETTAGRRRIGFDGTIGGLLNTGELLLLLSELPGVRARVELAEPAP